MATVRLNSTSSAHRDSIRIHRRSNHSSAALVKGCRGIPEETQMERGLLYNLLQATAAAKDWTDAANNNNKNALLFKQVSLQPLFITMHHSVNIYLVQPTRSGNLFVVFEVTVTNKQQQCIICRNKQNKSKCNQIQTQLFDFCTWMKQQMWEPLQLL